MTEVPIERALNRDILIELLENRDSEGDDRIGTLIKLTLFVLLLALKLVNFEARRNYDLNRENLTIFR